jgi:hypothetical protein
VTNVWPVRSSAMNNQYDVFGDHGAH